jgi:hypothetical protein
VHEIMYMPEVEKYIKGEIAKGRPVTFEAVWRISGPITRRRRTSVESRRKRASKRWSCRILLERSIASATRPGASQLRSTLRARSSSERT